MLSLRLRLGSRSTFPVPHRQNFIPFRLKSKSNLESESVAKAKKDKDLSHSFKDSLNLPTTGLPQWTKKLSWEEVSGQAAFVYKWQAENLPESSLFVSHDGPPYANGNVHIGHALNKILKDIINRYNVLRGKKVSYIPGWDCHGLPIEIKALEQIKNKSSLNAQEIRTKARNFALSEVEKQKKSFQSFGVMGDWENPYLTLDPKYESMQMEVFLEMFKKGLIYRGLRPVFWSPSSRTALAEAELEYPESHTSTSAYVAFPMTKLSQKLQSYNNVYALIWTTTPWTLPANLAITVNPQVEYCLVRPEGKKVLYLVAKERVEFMEGILGASLKVEAELLGEDLKDSEYKNPLPLKIRTERMPFLMGDYVTTQSGTGLVHTAPGHGMEDFVVCKANKLEEIRCPVDDAGKYTQEVGYDGFVGLSVQKEGNQAVLDVLTTSEDTDGSSLLLKVEPYHHKYPYDWRTKKPIIIRTTNQWFASLKGIHKEAAEAIGEVAMFPSVSKNRLESMIVGRNDWCISRQRVWGVPIPVFYKNNADGSKDPLITEESINHVRAIIEKEGSDAWFNWPVEKLLPARYLNDGNVYEKGTDTMDVWFDSGSSWNSVIRARGLPVPVDLYLEGSDQHRGWFQSSLLTAVSTIGKSPYKTVVTHGFTLDEKGNKMSKSLGNTIEPHVIINGGGNLQKDPAYGVDVLRAWVGHCDITKDVQIGHTILSKVTQDLKKVKNTLRFCLANLYDFDERKDLIPIDQLRDIDRYVLSTLSRLEQAVTHHYDVYQFYRVHRLLVDYCVIDLSTFYFTINKDPLYVELPNDHTRRSIQTVLYYINEVILKGVAPVACHTAEEVYSHSPSPTRKESVFQTGWMPKDMDKWVDPALEEKWRVLRNLIDAVNLRTEPLRKSGILASKLDTHATFYVSPSPLWDYLNSFDKDHFSDVLSTSTAEFILLDSESKLPQDLNKEESKVEWTLNHDLKDKYVKGEVYLTANKSEGKVCPRCWKSTSHSSLEPCPRCQHTLRKLSESKN